MIIYRNLDKMYKVSENYMGGSVMPESKRILNLAISVGELLLKSGAEIYRVQETVSRILESYGIKDYHVFVITNGIFATVYEQREDAASMVRYVPIDDVNLERVAEINQLTREICDGRFSIVEAHEKLENCKNSKGVKN